MMVGMVLFWGAILALAIWGVNILFPPQHESQPDPDREVASLEVLSARYARGEITREQFDLLRRDLEADESNQHLSSITAPIPNIEAKFSRSTHRLTGLRSAATAQRYA